MSSPLEVFREVAAAYPRCFWLDGGGAREWSGARSVIGWLEPDDVSITYSAVRREVTRHAGERSEVVDDDVFAALEAEVASGGPDDLWVGYLGYACRPDLPAATGGGLPDAVWMRPSGVRVFDDELVRGSLRWSAVATPDKRRFPRSTGDPPPSSYREAFDRVQEQLRAGNTYEVNLTYRIEQRSAAGPAEVYERLRKLNPAPYAGFVQHDVPEARGWLLSSSPERYARIAADRTIETRPIKGTTPRGRTPEDDEVQRRRLAEDAKFRAENLMIVDLLRNDLSMVCEPGTVEVPSLMAVESYPSVHQLVSTVRGRLREEVTTVEALRALFPAGSMTGAPKLRTMQVIEEVEDSPRGPYAGAFGWIAGDGRADLGVVIRSLAANGDGHYVLGTGGGITVRSDVADEHAESQWKAERLLAALEEER